MKKYCVTILIVLLISALVLTGCNINITPAETDPATQPTVGATVDAAGADDDFTTDMDLLIDLIPSEPVSTDPTDETEETAATTEATKGNDTAATTEPTQSEETVPSVTEKPTEPTSPSPTNSNGEIELPIIPG